LRRRAYSDADSWDWFFGRAGRRVLATRAPQDDAAYFASGERQLADIITRFGAPSRGTALEIGCGDGRMTLGLSRRYDRVHALDIAPAVLTACRHNLAGRANVGYLLGGSEQLAALPTGSVDFVLSATVLQHVSDRAESRRYLAEAGRLLRPGGVAALQLRAPGLRTRVRDLLVDTVRLFGARLPAFHRSWRGAVLTEAEARRAAGRGADEVGWHLDGHHAWLVISPGA
jgi:SAM-dependent methyltransferase